MPRLAAAREMLGLKDLPGAMAIYEQVLGSAGDRADILVTISGDLGSHGYVQQIVELVAPRYDADRHGPATGLNILQAYMALRNAGAAQHVLDLLFSLNRPELEERLYGFSNAIADLMADATPPPSTVEGSGTPGEIPAGVARVSLISISKPIWSYGLEPFGLPILPSKEGKFRRVAFAQLAVPGAYKEINEAMKAPEDELGRLSRALPLWLAETFYFSPHYAPLAAIGMMDDPAAGKFLALFPTEWTSENLRQLVDSNADPLDYIFTGALRQTSGDWELLLRVFEVKKFRERKTFSARWTPLTADVELAKLQESIRLFMEWSPEKTGLPYSAPAHPRAWLDALGHSLALFLADKNVLPGVPPALNWDALASQASTTPSASLAWLTARQRAAKLGAAPTLAEPALVENAIVTEAKQALG